MRQHFPQTIDVETDVADPQLTKRPDRAQRKMDNKGTRFRSISLRLVESEAFEDFCLIIAANSLFVL
jgi:hypothetical protein